MAAADSIPELAPELDAGPPTLVDRLMARLPLVLVIVGIAALQLLVAWFYFPTASASQQRAEVVLEQELSVDSEPPAESLADAKEVDLGAFTVTAYQPASNITLRIDFHLYATVNKNDEKDLLLLMDSRGNRVRDHVITIIRNVNLTDLNDAGLGLIKRRILETTNRTLGKPYLQSVLFSEFTFIEQ